MTRTPPSNKPARTSTTPKRATHKGVASKTIRTKAKTRDRAKLPSPEAAREKVGLLRTSASAASLSPTLSPSDHVRMLLELLRPCGTELARRWLAALMIVPADEREQVVAAIESRLASVYSGSSASSEGEFRSLVYPPVQKDGYTEQIIRTYEVVGEGAGPWVDDAALPKAEIEDKPERGVG